MNSPTPDAKSIFGRAAEIPSPADRVAFLDAACAGHPAVRAEVETLLKALGNAGSFMGHPAAPLGETVDHDTPITEGEGTVIGPYTLREQIGEGGMGLVFVAEQQQPVRRKVALKVIKPGMDTRQVVARFEAERQALALMDHPHIAKVLDAGTTASGLPYFVMELVRGVPITEYCDAANLTPKDRLGLFIQVCNAVQHAHQKGVIHRDLKPSNILVAPHDGVPVVKVIDFGVAKALGQSLTDKTIYTRFAQMIGTPLYMSPEQAEVNQLDVDTRSDVYSLGVLLYELLTGTTPFDGDRFRKAAFDEIRRIIKEEEPPRPSTRLTSLGATLTAVSAKRSTDPGKLAGLVRGELDWIVMRCLEKDRTRRYDGAAALAKDVQRHLNGDAVEACPPTLGYRLKKAYRRNKTAVLVGGLIAAVLLTATGVSLAFGVLAKRAEADAVAARNGEAEQREEVGKQRDLAVKLGGEASAERDKTKAALGVAQTEQDRVRRLLYASQMNSASLAFTEGRGSQLFRLLDEAAPRPGEPDVRGWEWHFLDRLTRAERQYKLDVPPPDQGYPLAQAATALAASRDGRWIVTRRTVGDGFVFDVTDAATGRKVGQVPKAEVLKDDWLILLLSEDGRHAMVTTSLSRSWPGGNAPQTRPDLTSPPRIWEIDSGKLVPAPAEPIKVRMSANRSDVALGANAAWVAWLEWTAPTAPRGLFRGGVQGPLEYAIRRWNAATGKVSATKVTIGKGWGLAHLAPDGRSVHWCPVSEQVAAGSGGGNANSPVEYGEYQVWDIEKPAKPRCALRVPVARGGPEGIAPPTNLSASWRWLSVWDRQKLTVHDLADGRVHWQVPIPAGYPDNLFQGFSGSPFGFVVSEDGNRVVAYRPDTFTVLDKTPAGKPAEWRVYYRPAANTGGSRNFHLLPDGRTLVRWEYDTVRVWDLSRDASGLALPNAPGVRQLVTDPDGQSWFVLRSGDGRRVLKWQAPPLPGAAMKGKIVPALAPVVLDGEGKELAKLDLGSAGTEITTGSQATEFLDSDRRLLVATIRRNDTQTGFTFGWVLYDVEKAGAERLAGGPGTLERVPNSPYLFQSEPTESFRQEPRAFAVHGIRTGKVIREFRQPPDVGFAKVPTVSHFAPDGRQVLVITTTESDSTKAALVRVELCDTATGQQHWRAELADVKASGTYAWGRASYIDRVRFTPDGSRVLISYRHSDGLRLGVWSAATGRHERTIHLTEGTPHRIVDFALASSGQHVALSLARSPLQAPEYLDVWNLDSGVRGQRITGFGSKFGQVAVSTDGTRVFATDPTPAPDAMGRLHVWDVSTGREVLTIPLGYDPNPYKFIPRGLRYDAGKLHVEHALWVRTLDGTPRSESKK